MTVCLITFAVTAIGRNCRIRNGLAHPKTFCFSSIGNHKSHSPYLLCSKPYNVILSARLVFVATRVLWLQFYVYLSTFYAVLLSWIAIYRPIHQRYSMDNGDDVNSTSTNGNRAPSKELFVNASLSDTTNDGYIRMRLQTSAVWNFFNKKRVGANVRWHWKVPMFQRSFSACSLTTSLRGHLNHNGH